MPEAAAVAQLLKRRNHRLDLPEALRVGKGLVTDDVPDAAQRAVADGVHQLFQVNARKRGEFDADILLGKHLAENFEVQIVCGHAGSSI